MTTARTSMVSFAVGIVPIALLIALWSALATFEFAPPSLLPAPQTVFLRLF